MPLSRGSAACGYIGLIGLFLALDIEITAAVPEEVQVDWEGILCPRYKDFISVISVWMYPSRKKTQILDQLPSVAKTFPTIRSMTHALNHPLPS